MKETINEQIFLSYAREDIHIAENIFKELRSAKLNIWFDKEKMFPGKKWKVEISKAIQNSKFFIAILSKNSISKRGYVQKELNEALEIFEQIPEDEIFIIPVRIDNCNPTHHKLNEIHWLDLFPDFHNGIEKLKTVFRPVTKKIESKSSTNIDIVEFHYESKPTIDIEFFARDLFSEKKIKCNALIDTGADICTVPKHILKELDHVYAYSFKQIRYFGKHGAGLRTARTFYLNFMINKLSFSNVEMLEWDSEIALIGLNVLNNFTLTIDGKQKKVTFS
jgi:hypothetical protein